MPQPEATHFQKIIDLVRELRSPHGCAWDREQTLRTIAPLILEEVYEVIEALDHELNDDLLEELGDVLWDIIFIAIIAEDEQRFTLLEILEKLADKIVRRHPHIWGEQPTTDRKTIAHLYEQVKKQDYQHKRKNPFDGIAPHLPALAKALKTVKKAQKSNIPLPPVDELEKQTSAWDEHQWGAYLFHLSIISRKQGIDLEQCLRSYLHTFVAESTNNQE